MNRILSIALALLVSLSCAGSVAWAQCAMGVPNSGCPGVPNSPPGPTITAGQLAGSSLDLNFQDGIYSGASLSNLTVARATTSTDLLWSSPSGAAFQTFANNTPRITNGKGLLIEDIRSNLLLNSGAPATQTTGTLGANTYTLWVNGTGSATMSAGTGTGCGTGVATLYNPVNFTITVGGTCTVTVGGSLNEFQLEAGAFPSSYIPTAGATVPRAADIVTLPAPSGGTQASIYAQAYTADVSANRGLYDFSDGTTANEIFAFAATSFNTLVEPSALTAFGGTPVKNVYFKQAVAVQASGAAQYANGSAAGTVGALTFPSSTTLYLGSRSNGTFFLNGYLQRIAFFGTALSTSALATFTTLP